MKKALITGITGQDGSYLAELLLEKGYKVYGIERHKSNENFVNINHILNKIEIISGDMTDQSSLDEAISTIKPDEVYNLAAQSFVTASWRQPILTTEINALGTLRLLESIRKIKPDTKFYQASSSEMYGKVIEVPQTETTPFYPRSPYAVSKVYAHYITINYRESYNMFTCCGICFNHESPRRGLEFVTRKITYTLANILAGKEKILQLGNLDAKRDWGYAKDYVKMMWLMLQQDKPEDFVIATGETHSVKDFVESALDYLGIKIQWEGKGMNCKGRVKSVSSKYSSKIKYGSILITTNPQLYRPAEVDLLIGNPAKAKKILKWKPEVKFDKLVKIMMESDIKKVIG